MRNFWTSKTLKKGSKIFFEFHQHKIGEICYNALSNFCTKKAEATVETKMHMMKQMMLAGLMMIGMSAFAGGADDTLITFSTEGAEPDRYADGTPVMDGECYALVWSKDGVFEGLKADGSTIDSEDRILLVAPLARDGHCPEIVFQVTSDIASQLASGKYSVVLLDTRVNTAGVVAPRGLAGGKLNMVNGYGQVTESMKISASDHATIDGMMQPGGYVAGENASAVEGVSQPRIKNIQIVGDNVFLTVENLNGFMRVQGGGTPDSVVTLGAATQTDGGTGDVTLVAPKLGRSGFYRVMRN